MSVITIFNSHNKKDQIIIRALPRTEQTFDWNSIQTATFCDFDYNAVKYELAKIGIHIGTKPDYFSLEHFNSIRFNGRRTFRVHDIHITLYDENEIISEPQLLVISFYSCNTVKKLFNKLFKK